MTDPFIHSKPPDDPQGKGKVSYTLKELLKTKVHPEEMSHKAHEEEEKLEIDERWLMSYADKMTLLCGFFILLFSISTLDPVKLQKVQESAEKSFGKPNSEAKETVVPTVPITEVNEIRQKVTETETKLETIQKTNTDLTEQIKKITEDTTKTITQLTQQVTVQTQTITDQQKVIEEQKQQITKTEQEREQITVQLAELTKKIPVTPQPTPEPVKKDVVDAKTFEKLKVTHTKLQAEHEKVETELVQKTTENTQLKEEIKHLQANVSNSDFIAFVMSWPTKDHDVDLVVEDPSKKTFNFKNRDFKNHPGLLVLDTRKGPGVEVWQADKILSGTYSITYTFYNSYGNEEPCPIKGTLFTSKGRLELPTIELSSQGKKKVSYKISVDENGKPQLIK